MKLYLHVTKFRVLFCYFIQLTLLFYLFLLKFTPRLVCVEILSQLTESLSNYFGGHFVFRNGQAWPAVVLPHGRAHLPADLLDRALQSADPPCRADDTDDSSSYFRGQAVDL